MIPRTASLLTLFAVACLPCAALGAETRREAAPAPAVPTFEADISTDSYKTTAAFLMWLEDEYGADLVPKVSYPTAKACGHFAQPWTLPYGKPGSFPGETTVGSLAGLRSGP